MPSTYTLKYLTGSKLENFLAVANQIIPPDEYSPGGGTMLTAGVVDWSLDKMPGDLRKKLLLFIKVIGFMGYFFAGKTFAKCSEPEQEKILKWLENNPLRLFRMGFFGVKTYVTMGYYTRDDIWKTFKYDGPVVSERNYVDPVIRDLCLGTADIKID